MLHYTDSDSLFLCVCVCVSERERERFCGGIYFEGRTLSALCEHLSAWYEMERLSDMIWFWHDSKSNPLSSFVKTITLWYIYIERESLHNIIRSIHSYLSTFEFRQNDYTLIERERERERLHNIIRSIHSYLSKIQAIYQRLRY
jgi:hypothetical protein